MKKVIAHMLEKVPFLYKAAVKLLNSFRLLTAFPIMWKTRKKKDHHGKIKVVFYSQMSTLWTNDEEIYRNMLQDERFEVYILAFPESDYTNIDFQPEHMQFHAYQYHVEKGHQNVINAYENGEWFDLRSLQPDYVFFERPYNEYIPEAYRIKNVVKYARTCYFPYAYVMMESLFEDTLNVDFFRYLHIFFADSYVSEHFHKKRMKLSHALGLRKTVLTNHPVFLNVLNAKHMPNPFWDNEPQTRVIWAPRWTIDSQLGGSNFLNYKDQIVTFFMNHKEMSLVFRPHPLTFMNFIAKGWMTKEDADSYLAQFHNNSNLHYDDTAEFFSTFWASDVFVGDISSVIPYYFITGKPLIYCHTQGYQGKNQILKKLIEASYQAYSWADVEKYLIMLERKEDPLQEKRIKLRDELFNEREIQSVPARIIAELVENHRY